MVFTDANSSQIKGTHKYKAPSKKPQALMKSMSKGIWVVDTLNQPFIAGSYTEIYFEKNKWQK